MSHDQNFKNLILDYPREALTFFADSEAHAIDSDVRIIPIRQEQLKERLGDRFRELDVPLLVEWPDGRREALLFALEEQTDPLRFSCHRLAHYCLDLSELFKTTRVVPVVIFLRNHKVQEHLTLGGDTQTYLTFHYLTCHLARLPFEHYQHSSNLVARLNLPNMDWTGADKVEVYASAIRGLLTLEPEMERRLKYLDFIDIYTGLNDNERQIYQQRYPEDCKTMTGFAERFIEKGIQEGMQQGMQKGEARVLLRLLEARFGPLSETQRQRVSTADADTLLSWSDRVLTANTLDEVLH